MRESLKATAFYLGDNVEVGPDVVIASGAVLEAAPGSRIVIGGGSCIGSGVVIQAHGGDLILAPGVNLGKEVLLVGSGSIGEQACIGAESTLINPQVEANAVIPARSLLGNPFSSSQTPETTFSGASEGSAASPETNGFSPEMNGLNGSQVGDDLAVAEENGNGKHPETASARQPVYGRDQVMQLVKTLFPHRDALNDHNGSS